MKIQAVVFDIGEVLIRLNFSQIMALRGLEPNQSLGDWLKQMDSWDLYDNFERGLVSNLDFVDSLQQKTGHSLSHEKFLEVWNSVLRETVPQLEERLRELSKHYSLFGLTNSNEIHMDYARSRYPILGSLKQIFTSYELKCRKPEKKIYQLVQKSLGLNPNEILFVDDRKENVEAAKALGWDAHHIQRSPEDVIRILSQLE